MQNKLALPQTWKVAPLSDLTVGDTVTYGVVQPGQHVPSGIPMLRVNNFRGFGLDTSDVLRIAPEVESKYERTRLQNGDVLLTIVGSVGQVAIVPRALESWNIARAVALVRPKESSMARWIALFLRSPVAQHALGVAANTTVQTTINLKDLKQLSVPIPPEEELEEIAATLSALDDKIALLRETNATLEAIAQAIFKSWFVDFDPVRAKMEGREPEGMDTATAALFPDSFEDSELGEIPRGWAVSTLQEHVTAERGLSYKGAGLCGQENGRPMHNLNSVYEGGGYKYPGIKFYSGDYKERHLAVAGDIIITNTEQGHDHRLIGFPAIIPAIYSEGLFSHHLYRVRRKAKSPLTQHTLYYMLMAPYVREQIIGCANGSTVNMLKSAGLEIPRFVCPSPELAAAFEELAVPIRQRIEQNIQQVEELSAIRDTLLPRLMSGKLSLEGASLE